MWNCFTLEKETNAIKYKILRFITNHFEQEGEKNIVKQ